jgi:hypothetical protein
MLLSFGSFVAADNGNTSELCQNCTQNKTMVVASQDPLLNPYATGNVANMTFKKVTFDNHLSYFHQRKIGDAYVELDGIAYAFDENDSLIVNRTHWRNDLPEVLPEVITEEQAEAIAGGDSAILVYIDPESSVFASIKPTPTNPCWNVYVHSSGFVTDSVVIDAVTGEVLGHGVPPPSEGVALTGPYDLCGCTKPFQAALDNATYWFRRMGYTTDSMVYPTVDGIKQYIQNDETAVFFETAHGGSYFFKNDCSCPYNDTLWDTDVQAWLVDHPKMPFAFLLSCDSMEYTEPTDLGPTFSYAFRKGSTNGTVTIGCCGGGDFWNWTAWWSEIWWQDFFFSLISQGRTVGDAFYLANLNYPSTGVIMRIAGDQNLKLVPKLNRKTAYITGETRDVNANLISGVFVEIYKYGSNSSPVAADISNSTYNMRVDDTGVFWMRSSKDTYFALDTNKLPFYQNNNHPYIKLLGERYVWNLEGDCGLVPKACTMSYAMKSVNHWLFIPTDDGGSPHPEWQLSNWKAMESVHSWLYPS